MDYDVKQYYREGARLFRLGRILLIIYFVVMPCIGLLLLALAGLLSV